MAKVPSVSEQHRNGVIGGVRHHQIIETAAGTQNRCRDEVRRIPCRVVRDRVCDTGAVRAADRSRHKACRKGRKRHGNAVAYKKCRRLAVLCSQQNAPPIADQRQHAGEICSDSRHRREIRCQSASESDHGRNRRRPKYLRDDVDQARFRCCRLVNLLRAGRDDLARLRRRDAELAREIFIHVEHFHFEDQLSARLFEPVDQVGGHGERLRRRSQR